MAKTKQKKSISFLDNLKKQFNLMSKKKKICYFSFLIITFICLALCLWGVVVITVDQQATYADLLNLRTNGLLEATYPQLAINGTWYFKGVEQFSWYLVSIHPISSIAYYFATICAIIATPLLIYYISSFLIVFFPKKDKLAKVKKKTKKQVKKEVQ